MASRASPRHDRLVVPFLETDRLTLRPCAAADTDHLVALGDDPEVARGPGRGPSGFTELGVERDTANTMAVNTRSRRVMEESGLVLVRTCTGDWPEPIEGAGHGEVEYGLTRAAWEGRRRA